MVDQKLPAVAAEKQGVKDAWIGSLAAVRQVRLLQFTGSQAPLSSMSCSIVTVQQGAGMGTHGAVPSACDIMTSELS